MIKAKSYLVLLETEVCSSSSISPDCSLSKSLFKRCNNLWTKCSTQQGKYSKSFSEMHKDIFAFFRFRQGT